jgi:hypothetical protein
VNSRDRVRVAAICSTDLSHARRLPRGPRLPPLGWAGRRRRLDRGTGDRGVDAGVRRHLDR